MMTIPTMSPRLAAAAVTLTLVACSGSSALERTATRLSDQVQDDRWSTSQSVTIAYYNYCTGWRWAWWGWSNGEQVAVRYDDLPGACALQLTRFLVWGGVGPGWGYTGTISIETDECPGSPIARQPWVAPPGDFFQWYSQDWGGLPVPDPFTVVIRWDSTPGLPDNAATLISDHPAPGATGPPACGTCYPATRQSHTLYFGVDGSICPGTTLNDGTCDVELLAEAALICATPLEQASWGKIKTLYR